MKKFLMLALCALPVIFSAEGLYAQYSTPAGFNINGLTPSQGRVVNAAQARSLPNKASFLMRGNIVQAVGRDRYVFRDSSGEITIRIKYDRWRGFMIGPEDRVEIVGEMKKEKRDRHAYADVRSISRAPANEAPQTVAEAPGLAFAYPLRGRLSSPYGWRNDPISGSRRFHIGIDLVADTGTPVKAAYEGRISTVGVCRIYGRYVVINHSDGYQTMYAHLNSVSVAQGANVARGAQIGVSGNTGYSTGPHLHFSIAKNGRALNPLDHLNS